MLRRGLLDRLEIRVQTSETDVRRGTFLVLYGDLKKNGCPLPDFGFGKFADVMAIPKNPTLYDMELKYSVVFGVIVYEKAFWNSDLAAVMPLHQNIDREGLAV